MQTFITVKLRLDSVELTPTKTALRALLGASLVSMEFFEDRPIEVGLPQKANHPPLPQAPDRLAEVLKEHNIQLPMNHARWKVAWRALEPAPNGEVLGFETLRGKIIATDGVKGILVRPNGTWMFVHIYGFKADKVEEGIKFTGKPKAERKSATALALEIYK